MGRRIYVRKRALGLAVAFIVGALFAVSASGAATSTKAQTSSKINVSTRAAVIHYLRSIHVSTKHVVIQRGLRNYAGANCPGKGWTCAGTRHTVVQITKQGGQNRYACTTAKCAVVQLASGSSALHAAPKPPPPPNTASCIKTTGITQSCTINQPSNSGTNTAIVWMVTPKLTGLTQSSLYTASITQGPTSATGSSNNNLACVNQSVWLDGSTTKTNSASTTVTNDNHESIFIQQNSLIGSNTVQGAVNNGTTLNPIPACGGTGSTMTQDEKLTSTVVSKGSITQLQNTAAPFINPQTGLAIANVVTDVEQNQDINGFSGFMGHASGVNTANFEQSSNQSAIANTVSGRTVTQQQNANVPNAPYSGGVGTINQDSSALSTANVTQTETQCEDAIISSTTPTNCDMTHHDPPAGIALTQTQYGPLGVFTPAKQSAGRVRYYHKGYGKSAQTGAAADVHDIFGLTQTSNQNADVGTGQQNIVQGDCASAGGSCTTSQLVALNSGTTQDGWSAPSIDQIKINCDQGQACTGTPPPAPTFVSGPNDPNPSASAAFNFTDTATGGIHFLCKIDGGTLQEVISTCSSGTAFFQGYGPHTFQVAASDSHGHVSAYVPATAFSWTNVPPDPTITASSKPTNPDFFGTSDTFKFTDTEDPNVNYRCTLDGNTTDCNGGSVTYTSADLAPGSHTFSVRAFDSTDTYGSINSASYTWTILPLSVSALGGTDLSSAGWACQPGGPIALTVGSAPYNPPISDGTFAKVTITNAGGTLIDGLSEPTFTTDNFNNGSPRYTIDLSDGHHLWGYPPNLQMGTSAMLWDGSDGYGVTWSQIQAIESGQTVTDAYVIADGDQSPGTTDKIGSLQFNGTTYNSGTCS